MQPKKSFNTSKVMSAIAWGALPLFAGFSLPSHAVQWTSEDGRLDVIWDNTVSYGAQFRVEGREPSMAAEGSFSTLSKRAQINKNDGNQNFDKGITSNLLKWTTELDAVWDGQYGAFVRATAFYDDVIMNDRMDGGDVSDYENGGCGTSFCPETKDEAGSNIELLDAYVWGDFELGDTPVTVRLGNQVLVWGEALFMQDGVNQINPVSLSSLRRPGAELKEAIIPLPMISAQTSLTSNLSMEAFYLFDWDHSEGDAVGTFLSTHDAFIGEGARAIITDLEGSALETVAKAYTGFAYGVDSSSAASTRLYTNRLQDREPGSTGQYGVAFHYFAEDLNATDFGFYYSKTHAKKQTAGIVLGEANGANQANSAACRSAQALIANLQPGSPSVDCANLNPAGFANAGYTQAEIAGAMQLVGGTNAAHFIDTTSYFLNYEDELETLGLSFNTLVGTTSFAGEIAYRKDVPFLAEVGDNLIIYNALAAADLGNGQTSTEGQYGAHLPAGLQAGDTVMPNAEEDMINASVLAIHSFGPRFGLHELNGLLEVGMAYVAGLDEDKLYAAQDAMSYIDIPGVAYDGNPDQYLTRSSWGYRVAMMGSINNAFNGVTLKPSLRFAHDVEGNSVFGGNFVEGRKSATLGMGAVYNFNWETALAYTNFWGATDRNQLQDRDYIAFSVKRIF
ncbi:MAG: DUF1302 domain-containing protein [Pseudomonadota bacterium]|nr:DUF1302 domain-containing protein [Pseudomonadota bacterium]